MKLDLTSKYILGIVGIVAVVGIVVMILNSAGDFSTDVSGQATAAVKTSIGAKASTAVQTKTTSTAKTAAVASLKVPEDPLENGATMEATVVSVVGNTANLQFEYSVPENFQSGSAMDMSRYLMEIEVVNIDTLMQDWQTFMDASSAGMEGGSGRYYSVVDMKYNAGSGYSGTTTTYSDGSKRTVTNHEGGDTRSTYTGRSDSAAANDQDGDGEDNSSDEDRDGDGVSNEEEEENGTDPDDPDDNITPESEGHYIIMGIFSEITNEITSQANTESLMNIGTSSALKSTLMTTLNAQLSSSVQKDLGDYVTSVKVTNIKVQ